MFDLQHKLWDMEEEEEEEEEEEWEESSFPEDSSADSGESCCEDCQECGRGWQDPAVHPPSQWHPHELRRCRRKLFTPYDLQGGRSLHWMGPRRGSGAETPPWGRGSPPWDPPLRSWVQDTRAIFQSNWHLEQAAAPPSRMLSHPSFQTFFAAVAARSSPSCQPASGGGVPLRPSRGPLPSVDCSSFFYTDPTMPPGCRIYNFLSASSLEVLHSLQLNTPAPIMCSRPASSPGQRWLPDLECAAASAPLAPPAGARGDASPCPAPGAADCGETGALAAYQQAGQQLEQPF